MSKVPRRLLLPDPLQAGKKPRLGMNGEVEQLESGPVSGAYHMVGMPCMALARQSTAIR